MQRYIATKREKGKEKLLSSSIFRAWENQIEHENRSQILRFLFSRLPSASVGYRFASFCAEIKIYLNDLSSFLIVVRFLSFPHSHSDIGMERNL